MAQKKKTIESKQLDLINEIGLHTLILKEGLFTPFLKKLFTSKVERAMRKASRDPHMKSLIKKFNKAAEDFEREMEIQADIMDNEDLKGGKGLGLSKDTPKAKALYNAYKALGYL